MDLTGRDDIYRGALAYLSDNPIIGSSFEYMRLYGRMPHNLILSAFIYGGLFGGLVIIILLFKQLKVCVRHYFNNNFSFNLRVISMAVAYCAVIADGIVHNLSIVNGDIIGWLIWSTLLGYTSVHRIHPRTGMAVQKCGTQNLC